MSGTPGKNFVTELIIVLYCIKCSVLINNEAKLVYCLLSYTFSAFYHKIKFNHKVSKIIGDTEPSFMVKLDMSNHWSVQTVLTIQVVHRYYVQYYYVV